MTVAALYAVRNTAPVVAARSLPLCRHADLLLDRIARTHGDGPLLSART